MIFYPII